jgi:hypothetical protein
MVTATDILCDIRDLAARDEPEFRRLMGYLCDAGRFSPMSPVGQTVERALMMGWTLLPQGAEASRRGAPAQAHEHEWQTFGGLVSNCKVPGCYALRASGELAACVEAHQRRTARKGGCNAA